MNKFTEIIELSDRTITVTHNTALSHMFWIYLFKPFYGPFRELLNNFKPTLFTSVLYGIFAWYQGLFETSVILDLFEVPEGLIEGLTILVICDFVFGSIRAIVDSRIKFHPKKWIKSFFKVVVYTGGVIVLTVGANMFENPFRYIQHGGILLIAGYEIWSCLKHLKLTAFIYAGWEIYKNRDNLGKIDFKSLYNRIDERSAQEFAEKQMYYFGDEKVTVESKTKAEKNA